MVKTENQLLSTKYYFQDFDTTARNTDQTADLHAVRAAPVGVVDLPEQGALVHVEAP